MKWIARDSYGKKWLDTDSQERQIFLFTTQQTRPDVQPAKINMANWQMYCVPL
jgi:hypothetical protein